MKTKEFLAQGQVAAKAEQKVRLSIEASEAGIKYSGLEPRLGKRANNKSKNPKNY